MFKRNREPYPGTGHSGANHSGTHGENAEKYGRIGWEIWSRRPGSSFGGIAPRRWAKRYANRIERRVLAKEAIREALQDVA